MQKPIVFSESTFLDLALPKRVEDRTLIDPKYSFEFLRRMKTEPEFKNIKVLIFSGHSEKEFEDEAKKDGADAYIHKSESLPKDLVVVVTNLLKDFKK
jgi:CheY-like chemotaxis protein